MRPLKPTRKRRNRCNHSSNYTYAVGGVQWKRRINNEYKRSLNTQRLAK